MFVGSEFSFVGRHLNHPFWFYWTLNKDTEEAPCPQDRINDSSIYVCTFLRFYVINQHQIRKETRQHWFPSTFLKRNVGISGFFLLLRFIWLISENFSHGNYTALPSFSSDSQMIWDSVKVPLSVKWFLMVILKGISSSECY